MPTPPIDETPTFVAHHRASDNEWQPLADHLTGVGTLAAQFSSKLGLQDLGELLGLLHDFGKFSFAFQTYLKSAIGVLNQDEDEDWVDAKSLKGKVDHSTAGAQFAWHALSKGGLPEQIVGQVVALCIASHHSGLIDCVGARVDTFGKDVFNRRMQKAQEQTHLDEVRHLADPQLLHRCNELLACQSVVTKFQELLIQIGRANTTHQQGGPLTAQQQFGLLVRFMFSCLIDADRVDTADFERHRDRKFRPGGRYTGWPVLVDRLERHLVALPPTQPIDHLRQDISRHCQHAADRPSGIYTLTVPTGGGKTLASCRIPDDHMVACGTDAGASDTTLSWPASAYCS